MKTESETIAELLPCHFCGSKPEIQRDDLVEIECKKFCQAQVICFEEKDAISDWNRRAPLAQPKPIAAPQDGWIAISDRLPEYEVMVVILDENTTMATGSDYAPYHTTCGYLRNSGTQDYWSIPYRSGVDSTAFTHWMPLPKAPS